jgi:hypothetical protein
VGTPPELTQGEELEQSRDEWKQLACDWDKQAHKMESDLAAQREALAAAQEALRKIEEKDREWQAYLYRKDTPPEQRNQDHWVYGPCALIAHETLVALASLSSPH